MPPAHTPACIWHMHVQLQQQESLNITFKPWDSLLPMLSFLGCKGFKLLARQYLIDPRRPKIAIWTEMSIRIVKEIFHAGKRMNTKRLWTCGPTSNILVS